MFLVAAVPNPQVFPLPQSCSVFPLPAAVRSMKSLLFYPILTFVFLVLLMAYWIFVTAFLASIGGDIDQKSVMTSAQVQMDCMHP